MICYLYFGNNRGHPEILFPKRWSSLMVDTRIRILRSNNQLHLASLFSSPAWCPIDGIWYAWVQWNEDGTNPMVRKDKSYQKRIPLSQLLQIEQKNPNFVHYAQDVIEYRIIEISATKN